MDQACTFIAQPPVMLKSSMKAGKFVPAFSIVTQPCPTDFANTDLDDAKDGPDLYGTMIDVVSDGMHMIIASFIKTNDKSRGQLLKSFAYLSEVMCANINGLKIHLVFTGKPLPKFDFCQGCKYAYYSHQGQGLFFYPKSILTCS
jgi:hypothetical protein